MSDMFVGSQAPLYQNVYIRRRTKSGKILEERFAKNRVTRLMLYGIGKFLLGHFNNSSPDKIYEYIPRYLALGTNTPGSDASVAGVTTISSVNDTRLLNEIKQLNTTGETQSVKRIWIAERNMCKINTKFSDPFIKVSIKAYISSKNYDGMSIGEAGLFSKEQDNNCLARVCFSPILKNEGEVLDIQWDITLLSYGETKYPEKLEIENGSKIVLPLKYTNKYFEEIPLGLTYNNNNGSIIDNNGNTRFTYIEDDKHNKKFISDIDIYNKLLDSAWYTSYFKPNCCQPYNLSDDEIDSLLKTIIKHITNCTLSNSLNPFYLYDLNQNNIPTMIHFGNLYKNSNTKLISDNELAITLLFNEDLEYTHIDTRWKYLANNINGSYTVISPKNETNKYQIVKNRFYKKSEADSTKWVETNAFLYNGTIVDINQESLGYTYNDNKFYKTTITKKPKLTNQYLNHANCNGIDGMPDTRFHLYSYNENNSIFRTGYTIDYKDDQKIYQDNNYTYYHLSEDNYWVTGDYEKLIPIITPKDATDRTISWYIQNRDIAKINFDGVVTAWNIGETSAIASTSNDMRSKCIIQVVKESKFIDVDSIDITPNEVVFTVNKDINQYYILSASVEPLFASNSTVTWEISYELQDCIKLINLGDNKVKIILNESGNIGTGYVTASSQSGKTAKCLVRVIYNNNDECDCLDESHLKQEA